MLAVNCELVTSVVARLLPFHFTTEPETSPEPFTVRLNPAPPGVLASGTNGWLMTGTGFTVPVPVRVTVWGLPGALSVIDKVAVRGPIWVGVKVTLMVQLARGTTDPPQVLVWAKSPASFPLMGMLVISSVLVP